MKQKYSISIADVPINIVSEGAPEEVNAIVNKVDTAIRSICGKSNNVSKIEAAILCALEFCAISGSVVQNSEETDSKIEELTEELKKSTAAVAKLEARLETQKEKSDASIALLKERQEEAIRTQKEKYEGRIENMKEKYEARIAQLKSKLDEQRAAAAEEAASQQISMDIPAEDAPVEAAPAVEEAPAAAPEKTEEPAEPKKSSKSSKVGSMFELLTFGDV